MPLLWVLLFACVIRKSGEHVVGDLAVLDGQEAGLFLGIAKVHGQHDVIHVEIL